MGSNYPLFTAHDPWQPSGDNPGINYADTRTNNSQYPYAGWPNGMNWTNRPDTYRPDINYGDLQQQDFFNQAQPSDANTEEALRREQLRKQIESLLALKLSRAGTLYSSDPKEQAQHQEMDQQELATLSALAKQLSDYNLAQQTGPLDVQAKQFALQRAQTLLPIEVQKAKEWGTVQGSVVDKNEAAANKSEHEAGKPYKTAEIAAKDAGARSIQALKNYQITQDDQSWKVFLGAVQEEAKLTGRDPNAVLEYYLQQAGAKPAEQGAAPAQGSGDGVPWWQKGPNFPGQ